MSEQPMADDAPDDIDAKLTWLEKLGVLRTAGILTEEEFQAQKAAILVPARVLRADVMSTDDQAPRPFRRDLVVVMGRLARLRDADVFTEAEFQRERVKVVAGWTPHVRAQQPATAPSPAP